jgi:hypothetical protein
VLKFLFVASLISVLILGQVPIARAEDTGPAPFPWTVSRLRSSSLGLTSSILHRRGV